MEQKARLILDSHENMAKYADEASVDGICFNFGYLPGSDHSLATKPESSKNAVIEGLRDCFKKRWSDESLYLQRRRDRI